MVCERIRARGDSGSEPFGDGDFLLLEDGASFFLLETGDKLIGE